jgi:hypothetical protein
MKGEEGKEKKERKRMWRQRGGRRVLRGEKEEQVTGKKCCWRRGEVA